MRKRTSRESADFAPFEHGLCNAKYTHGKQKKYKKEKEKKKRKYFEIVIAHLIWDLMPMAFSKSSKKKVETFLILIVTFVFCRFMGTISLGLSFLS